LLFPLPGDRAAAAVDAQRRTTQSKRQSHSHRRDQPGARTALSEERASVAGLDHGSPEPATACCQPPAVEHGQQTKIFDATGRGFIAVTGTIDQNNTMRGNGTHAGPLTLRKRLARLIADDPDLAD
jgi:hypothetical protein